MSSRCRFPILGSTIRSPSVLDRQRAENRGLASRFTTRQLGTQSDEEKDCEGEHVAQAEHLNRRAGRGQSKSTTSCSLWKPGP